MTTSKSDEDEIAAACYKAPFPHCDSNVLHSPGTCVYCDHYPLFQQARLADGVGFTNEPKGGLNGRYILHDCPSTFSRTVEQINRWPGNRAQTRECEFPCHAVVLVDDAVFDDTEIAEKKRWWQSVSMRELILAQVIFWTIALAITLVVLGVSR